MTTSTIIALAILKVNWDIGKDYLEAFVTLVVECIRRNKSSVVSLPELQKSVYDTFGLEIPLNPMRQILKKSAKRGFLRKEHGVFYCNHEKCSEVGFQDAQRKVETIFDSIITKLIKFAKNKHSIDWTQNEAVPAIHEFLRNNSLSLLFSLTEDTKQGITQISPVKPAYIVGDFISDAQLSDQQLLEDIDVILKGNLLANALYLPDVGHVRKRFRNTKVYLDTSVIVYSVGFAGPNRSAPCLELLKLLVDYGAELCCFQNTYDEVCGILDACAARLRKGNLKDAYGPTIEYFIQSGKTASDIELMIVRLPQKLRILGITVDQKPSYKKKYQIDEQGFENALENEIHYSNPKARIHDVDCISAIARIRKRRESLFPETSWALFVTTNSALAKITRGFFPPKSSPGSVAYCITDYALGNLLWLKNPIKAPDLPRRRLIADAYAAMQPSEHLWKKYLIEITLLEQDSTISADDYYLLRYSIAAKSALMDLTQGDESVFSEGTIQEILEIAKENIKTELKHKLEKEVEQRQAAEKRVETLQESQQIQRSKLQAKANKLAKIVKRLATVLLFALIVAGILLTFPWNVPLLTTSWLNYLLPFGLITFLLLTIANLLKGLTVNIIMEKFESFVSKSLYKKFIHFAEIDETNEKNVKLKV